MRIEASIKCTHGERRQTNSNRGSAAQWRQRRRKRKDKGTRCRIDSSAA